ncbi:hypothetical protein CP500_009290, partial [Tychonema bourrellyi FEM_GT703]
SLLPPHSVYVPVGGAECGFLRGARGDLDLIVKQPSLTGLELKLTLMGNAVSLPTRRYIGKKFNP